MATKDIKGISIEIGGTVTKLDKAIKESDNAAKGLQKELTAVNRLLKFDPTSTELLTQKQKILAQEITETKSTLKLLKTAQEQFDASNVDSEEYRSLQREIAITEQSVKNLEKQQREFGTVSAQILKKTGDDWQKVGGKISSTGSKMMPATGGILALGAAATVSASDMQESQNKVDVAFEGSAKKVHEFAETTLDTYGISKSTSLEMASLFGDMATGMKLPEAAAAEMSIELVGLAGDLASFKNVRLDVAQTALKGIFTGETESLKTLGIVMTQANLDIYAMENGYGKTTAKMTEAEKVQLRFAYVTDVTSKAQGDFARTTDGTANSMRVAGEATKELSASFGEILAPIIAKIAQAITRTIKKITSMSETWKTVILIVAAVVAAIGPVLIIIGKIATGIGALMKIGAMLIPVFSGVSTASAGLGAALTVLTGPIGIIIAAVAALAAAIVYMWKNNEEFRTAVIALWESIKAKISEVVQSIQPIIAMFTAFLSSVWQNCADAITMTLNGLMQTFSGIFNLISTIVIGIIKILTDIIRGDFTQLKIDLSATMQGIWMAISTIWNGIASTITGVLTTILGAVITIWNGIVSTITGILSAIYSAITSAWESFTSVIATACNAIWNGISTIWNNILGFFRTLPAVLSGIGSAMFNSMAAGIASTIQNVYNTIVNGINSAINWIKALPAQAVTWGRDMISGFISGINSMINGIIDSVKGLAGKIASYLHFTCPDIGPLSNYESWMPDFMQGLATGIEKSKYKVVEAMKSLSSDMNLNVSMQNATKQAPAQPTREIDTRPTFTQYNKIISPKALSPSETARITRRETQKIVAGLKA